MTPFVYALNIMRICLQIQDSYLAMAVNVMTPGTVSISGNPPLFTPGQLFEGMVDVTEQALSKAARG